jgi:hypothetical protein
MISARQLHPELSTSRQSNTTSSNIYNANSNYKKAGVRRVLSYSGLSLLQQIQ